MCLWIIDHKVFFFVGKDHYIKRLPFIVKYVKESLKRKVDKDKSHICTECQNYTRTIILVNQYNLGCTFTIFSFLQEEKCLATIEEFIQFKFQ